MGYPLLRLPPSGSKLTPTSLGAGPSCSTFEVAVPSEPQTPRARSRSTQDARDRLHQDHRLRVPASASLSEGRTQYTGGQCPGVSTRCQSPRTNRALTTGPGRVASVRRRVALESLWRLAPFELPRGERLGCGRGTCPPRDSCRYARTRFGGTVSGCSRAGARRSA